MLDGLKERALAHRYPLLVALVLGLFFALGMPPYSAPDEMAHLAYIAALAQGHLPIIPLGEQADIATGTTWQGQHPPLYYLLGTPVYWLCGQRALPSLYALRVLNIFIFLGVVLMVAHLARRLNDSLTGQESEAHSTKPEIVSQSVAVWLVAAHPTIAYIASGVNNEMLGVLLGLVGIWLSLESTLAARERKRFWLVAATICCGLALLTKFTAIAAVGAATVLVMRLQPPSAAAAWKRGVALAAGAFTFWLSWAGVMKAVHGVWVPSPIVRPLLTQWGEILLLPVEALKVLALGMGSMSIGMVMPYWLLAPFGWAIYVLMAVGGLLSLWAVWQLRSPQFRFAGVAFGLLYLLLMAQLFFRDFRALLFLARYSVLITVLMAFPASCWWARRSNSWRRAGALGGALWSLSTAAYIAYFFWVGIPTDSRHNWKPFPTEEAR